MILGIAAALVAALAGAGAGAATRPPIQVLRNEPVLLESVDGEMISCSASLDDAGRPRMACGVVDFREGFVVGPVANTSYAVIARDGLSVFRAATPPELRFHADEPTRATGAVQLRSKSYRTLVFRYGRRYRFSGTSVGCTVSRSETAVTCDVVDARFRPARGSHGFTLGFRTLVVKRVAGAGVRTVVFTATHGE